MKNLSLLVCFVVGLTGLGPAAAADSAWLCPVAWATGYGAVAGAPISATDAATSYSETGPPSAEDADLSAPWRPEAFVSFAFGDEGQLASAHVGAERMLDDFPKWGIVPQLGLGPGRNVDEDYTVFTSFDLVLRRYVGEPAPGEWEMFYEAGAGLQYTGPSSFPSDGTHFNGRLRLGFGGRYVVEDRVDLIAGLNWLHMSNGNAIQPNVGHDGPMFYFRRAVGVLRPRWIPGRYPAGRVPHVW